ncbi:unnamed protein product [Arabis nemorensis]|uniref:Uncharacterized protein n=1 Tax=Arabis nemorensis TaxID=586526 RepID=A0A565BEA1_9BRAS|nr:unnamed protein product [Arabis nemorensis]
MHYDKELTSNGKSPEGLKADGSLLMKVFGVLAGRDPKRVRSIICDLPIVRDLLQGDLLSDDSIIFFDCK